MMKKFLKLVLPDFLIKYLRKIHWEIELKKFKKLDNYDVFKKIYTDKLWTPENEKNNFKFYSGAGSHETELTKEYIIKTTQFLKSFKQKPDILELGCGDFDLSSKLVEFSNNFIACDIFDELIETNKIKYNNLKVEFRVLDMTKDDLPKADICIVRYVLQHLSNEMILKFITKIKDKFRFLLITEHYPEEKDFIPNLNIITGPDIRLDKNSAVDLSEPPFNLKFLEKKDLCESSSKSISGYLRTQIYRLQ